MADIGFTGYQAPTQNGFIFIGKSGTCYVGGYNGWSQAADEEVSFNGLEPIWTSTGGKP